MREQQESYENAKKMCCICKEQFEYNMVKIKNVLDLGSIVILQGNVEVLRTVYVI